MKTFIYTLLLTTLAIINSIAQDPCPGPMAVLDCSDITPVCGSTSLYEFTVWTDVPNSNVSYVWGLNKSQCFQLPSGWTFDHSTSNGTETHQCCTMYKHKVFVIPSAFGGNNASITIKSFSQCNPPNIDYSTPQTFNGIIHRPASSAARAITQSTSLLCNGNTATFTLSTETGDNTFSWSTSGPISINSGQSTSTLNVGPTGNGASYANVSFKDGCSNNISRSAYVYTGTPVVNNFTVNYQTYNPSTNGYVCTGSNQYIQADIGGSASTNWSLTSGNSWNCYFSGYGNTASFTPNGTDYFNISLDATNSCGTGSRSLYFYSYDCYYRYSISPNPAADQVTIQFDQTEKAEALPDEISLFSEKSTKPIKTVNIQEIYQKKGFTEGTKVEIPVKELARGVYYIKVFNSRQTANKQVESTRILLQ